MAYSIENRYSVLNNYHYHNKPAALSFLDWLSTPCRRVLGGRHVHVINQTYQLPGSLAARVTTLFLSLIIFPIALVSVASFGIKLLSLPWFWQKNQIQTQSLQAQAPLQKLATERQRFVSLIGEHKIQEAIDLYLQTPKIAEGHDDVYRHFVWAIDWKIQSPHSWLGLPKALALLKSPDLIDRLYKAIQARLTFEINHGHKTTGQEIRKLISASMKGYSRDEQAKFVQKILDDVLTCKSSDNLLLRAIKLDLADELILFFKELKYSEINADAALVQLRIAAQQQNETTQRLAVCRKSGAYTFLNAERVEKLRKGVSSLHTIQLYVEGHIQKATSAQGTSIEEKKALLGEHLRTFSNALPDSLKPFSTADKQTFIEHAQAAIQGMVELLECPSSNMALLIRLAASCSSSLKKLTTHYQAFKPTLSAEIPLDQMLNVVYLHATSLVVTSLTETKSKIIEQLLLERHTTLTSNKGDNAS